MANKRENFKNLVKNYLSDFKISQYKINGPWVTIYQSCSNYFDWLKNMAATVCDKFFSYVNIGNLVREATLANVFVLLVESFSLDSGHRFL